MPSRTATARLPLIGTVVAALAALSGGAATAAPVADHPRPEPAVVHVQDGQLRGTVGATVRLFNGVPYAAPPVGALRWQPPQAAAPWSGVRDAVTPSAPCAQSPAPFLPGASTQTGSTSEDCLYLNVWTPVTQQARPRPVFVWIHGGANMTGAGSDYDPTNLVTHGDAIVVTINYRLGALGWLAHPAFSAHADDHASGDYGLMDQQAALRWVRANIRAFGGDPGQVTVGGESAGSEDTCMLLASPTARGLFARAIQESGSCLVASALAPTTLNAAEAQGLSFAATVGCADPATAAACLRAVPVGTLLAQFAAQSVVPNTGTRILPIAPVQAWASGRANEVPVLLGSNHDEYRLFTGILFDLQGHPLTPASYVNQIHQQFPSIGDQVLAAYPVGAYPSANIAYSTAITDEFFACPARADAILYAAHVPVYEYEFNDPTSPPFFPDPFTPQGAFHASELAYVFIGEPLTTDGQRALSATIDGYWTRFINGGNPNRAGLPAWPRYRPSGAQADQIQNLSQQSVGPIGSFATDHKCGLWQTLQGIPA